LGYIFTTVSTSPMAISQWVLHKTFASAWPTFLAAVGWLCLRLAYRFQAALPPFRLHISALFCVFWLPPPPIWTPMSPTLGNPLWSPLNPLVPRVAFTHSPWAVPSNVSDNCRQHIYALAQLFTILQLEFQPRLYIALQHCVCLCTVKINGDFN